MHIAVRHEVSLAFMANRAPREWLHYQVEARDSNMMTEAQACTLQGSRVSRPRMQASIEEVNTNPLHEHQQDGDDDSVSTREEVGGRLKR